MMRAELDVRGGRSYEVDLPVVAGGASFVSGRPLALSLMEPRQC